MEIKDITLYTKLMQKGLSDKLFWLDKLPELSMYNNAIVDFGCADGSLLKRIDINPKMSYSKLYGYDISPEMIELAKKDGFTDITFTSDWEEIVDQIHSCSNKTLLLSSVIHEVYSYAKDKKEISDFYAKLDPKIFDVIVVRDMLPSKTIEGKVKAHEGENCVRSYIRGLLSGEQMLEQFEQVYGSISENKNFVHFLLKYQYNVNWNRELHENYFPIYVEDLIQTITSLGYTLDYLERFRVPYMDDCISQDFHIILRDFTHAKLIFRANES